MIFFLVPLSDTPNTPFMFQQIQIRNKEAFDPLLLEIFPLLIYKNLIKSVIKVLLGF